MSRVTLLIAGAVAVIAVGFILLTNRQQIQQPVEEIAEEVGVPQEVVVLGEQNESGQVGTATLTEEDGRVTVSINVTGGDEEVPQPAHIHMGTCPNPGEVIYPLSNVVDGDSETTLEVTMEDLKSKMPLAINVHKSARESGVYVACGNLSL
jgi:Ni,Fe-hydrogenase III small subunit